jgi:hypothetical protein
MRQLWREQCPLMRYVILTLGLALVAGCGGSGGGGGGTPTTVSANAPVLANFRIVALNPEKANAVIRYQITVTVTDADNDVAGGQVELSDGTQTLALPIDAGDLQGNTIGVILVTNPVPAGTYPGTFDIVDAAGHKSNVIAFAITVNAQATRGDGSGRLLLQLLPAR